MTEIIKNLQKGQSLSFEESKSLFSDLMEGKYKEDKIIMGIKHKDYNIHGFQFHPESISTKIGIKLIKNFIAN